MNPNSQDSVKEQGNDRIAVFVDDYNVSHRDFKYVIDEIKNYGRIICSYVYADWSQGIYLSI